MKARVIKGLLIFQFTVIILISLTYTVYDIAMANEEATRQVKYFPAGIHRIEKLELSTDFSAIRGEGSGVTILEVPGGITITGKDPRLKGFTLRGTGNKGIGITLKNNYRALIEDVEIQGYELGLLSLCTFGNRQWLHTYRDLFIYEGEDGRRSYDPRIRGVELRYEGEKTEKGTWDFPGGGFSNTH